MSRSPFDYRAVRSARARAAVRREREAVLWQALHGLALVALPLLAVTLFSLVAWHSAQNVLDGLAAALPALPR